MIQDESTENDLLLICDGIKYVLDRELQPIGENFNIDLDQNNNLIVESLTTSSC